MNKKKKLAIGASVAILIIGLALYLFIGRQQKGYGKLNAWKDAKIFVESANANRISLVVFFPLKDEVTVPGTFELEKKSSGGSWKAVRENHSSDMDDSEYNMVSKESIYDASDEQSKRYEKYRDIGYGTQVFEFIDRYDSLEKGTYRVIFPVKKGRKRYDLSVEFTIDRTYEYTAEPEDYDYIAMTSSYLELILEYEACLASGKYVTYGDFLLGFQNHMFSRNLYEHLSGIQLSMKGQKKSLEQKDLKKFYGYLASAILSRQGKSVYGSTLFCNLEDLSYHPLRSGQKDEASKEEITLSLTFDYDREEKQITCKIDGHRMKVETKDFYLDEEYSSPMSALGDPILTTKDVEGQGIFADFYVYNDLYGKALETLEK